MALGVRRRRRVGHRRRQYLVLHRPSHYSTGCARGFVLIPLPGRFALGRAQSARCMEKRAHAEEMRSAGSTADIGAEYGSAGLAGTPSCGHESGNPQPGDELKPLRPLASLNDAPWGPRRLSVLQTTTFLSHGAAWLRKAYGILSSSPEREGRPVPGWSSASRQEPTRQAHSRSR